MAAKILAHHRALEEKERIVVTETIRTYHAVDNRVKDHYSGFTQSYKDTIDDLSEMIQARRNAKLAEIQDNL